MRPVGLLLFLASGVVGGALLVGGRNLSDAGRAFGHTYTGMSQTGLLAIAMGLGFIFAIGILMIMRGFARARAASKVRSREAEQVANEREVLARRVQLESEETYDLREKNDLLVAQRDALAEALEAERHGRRRVNH